MQLPRVRAPQLPPDPALWLNSGGAARAIEPGTVTLLDFWTYCCINCLHILPDLAYLEAKYRDRPLRVIGVHSGKFPQERAGADLENALRRLRIAHPVVRDDDYQTWKSYGIRAWPTLVLIDADGYVVGAISGEGHRNALDQAIGELFASYDAAGRTLAPAALAGSRLAMPDSPLAFPGKVCVAPGQDWLFVADTGHHRIVAAPLSGDGVCQIYGDGCPGLVDGPGETARFRSPQGLALSSDGRILFVADTENHAIRAIDRSSGSVCTLAGTGRQGDRIAPGPGREVSLNSPWDICLAPDSAAVFVAMAGAHQIGRLDLSTGTLTPWAGTGREARTDGTLSDACFAQPSGLATDGARLFVADSESSSIRAMDAKGTSGEVSTLAGGDLFAFGHRDGIGEAARFQHPLGIAWSDGVLYVADTYNHAVRAVDPATAQVATVTAADGSGTLREPGGIAAVAGSLYVADTNQHRIVRIDPRNGRIDAVCLPGLAAPTEQEETP